MTKEMNHRSNFVLCFHSEPPPSEKNVTSRLPGAIQLNLTNACAASFSFSFLLPVERLLALCCTHSAGPLFLSYLLTLGTETLSPDSMDSLAKSSLSQLHLFQFKTGPKLLLQSWYTARTVCHIKHVQCHLYQFHKHP